MRPLFPLFQSHLDLAHSLWAQIVNRGDCVIDATCGNGHDTLTLGRLVLDTYLKEGKVYGIDLQQKAIAATHTLLDLHLPLGWQGQISLHQQSHRTFPNEITPKSVKLIVYNLGYLPGGNKEQTTITDSTLQSLNEAIKLLAPGGAISMTCYPGHPEGAKEQAAIIDLLTQFSPKEWSCTRHEWLNRKRSPQLFLIQNLIDYNPNV